MSKDLYSNDNFQDDDFEFKPLTRGLGFQKQPEKQVAPTETFTNPTPTVARVSVSETLPRHQVPNYRSESVMYNTNTETTNRKIEDILSTLKNRPRLEIVEKPEVPFVKSSFELAAGVIDGLLIFALNLLALIGFIYTTRLDFMHNIRHATDGSMLYLGLAGLFITMSWSYLTATRIFLGQTAGEWVFEQRVGEPNDLGQWNYFGKILLRSTLVIATGFITLPILSMLFRKDVVGGVVGAELLRAK